MSYSKTHAKILVHLMFVVAIIILSIILTSHTAQNTLSTSPADLSPMDVVQQQLKALQTNPLDDKGIQHAYQFTSPQQKWQNGGWEQYSFQLKNSFCKELLNCQHFELMALDVHGERAQQLVKVINHEGKAFTFMFELTKYHSGWLTDNIAYLKALPAPQV
ncbi:DUF4864 domain-containing protein [Rapidithrix thailandica]|uniref:DUF4864 domain-containing protein n=1 Tax=Rapidithrix thailandica TaxID=413964 RepID=A0AAW9RTC4_9BACT